MQKEAEQIHEASLKLLAEPGIKIDHQPIRERLLKAGAKPGATNDTIKIPRELISEYMSLCPPEVHLANRSGGGKVITARGESAIWSVPGLNIYQEGIRRPFTSKDMANISRLMENLNQVDGVFGMAMADITPNIRDVVGLRIMAENTTKHIRVLCFTPAGADCLMEMKKAIGAYPWFSVGFTAHGPLRWTSLALEIFERTAGEGVPATINGEPMAGVSGPITLAGSAAVGNAEILAGIVINQLLEPGRPCIYNLGLAHTFDMRTMIAVTGGPENALYAKISAAMGRFYNIPSASWVSTESICVDSQAALEKMCGFHTHLDSGVTNIWGVGQLESELTISPAQAVIDNEIIAYSKRYLRGVEINDETLALDTIREVGISGSFLETMHTAENFRDELFFPSVLNRLTYEGWRAKGGKTLAEQAESTAQELMAKPMPPALTNDQAAELKRLEDAFARRTGGGNIRK